MLRSFSIFDRDDVALGAICNVSEVGILPTQHHTISRGSSKTPRNSQGRPVIHLTRPKHKPTSMKMQKNGLRRAVIRRLHESIRYGKSNGSRQLFRWYAMILALRQHHPRRKDCLTCSLPISIFLCANLIMSSTATNF